MTHPTASEGKCGCVLRRDVESPVCDKPDYETLTNVTSGKSMTYCVSCGHDPDCHGDKQNG
jgi:hypothetical protein